MAGTLRHPAAEGEGLTGVSKQPAAGAVGDYTDLAYHLVLVRDAEDKARPWTASVEELPGCTSHGKTSDEALDGIEAAMAKWISVALEEGRDVPEPRSAATHSGRLLLRMPKTLHAELTRVSEQEGVSLNQFITDVLASAIVWRGGPRVVSQDSGLSPASPLQAPGADSLTTESPSAQRRRARRTNMITMALVANLVIVALAGIVAIVVLIAAWQ
jgi:predicted RNase H-like HicB family nuclease